MKLTVETSRYPSYPLSLVLGEDNILELESMENKISTAVWGPFDETIIAGHSNGDISIIEVRVSVFQL